MSNYKFKAQSIVNVDGEEIGKEILLHGSSFCHLTFLQKDVLFESLNAAELLENKGSVFVNLERNLLCDTSLLQEIHLTSKRLNDRGIELVMEITERNICGICSKIQKGLHTLHRNNVSLAIDDYDYLSDDFRYEELNMKIYKYIKVNTPLNDSEYNKLSAFSLKHKNTNIIIERIETESFLLLNAPMKPWGMQGFLFCRGIEIKVLN